MILEKVEDFQSKKDQKMRDKAAILSVRAREAAGVVQQFGNAVVEGKKLISADDIKQMVHRLNYYADWLARIAMGEEVAEDDLVKMEEIISTIRVPKKNKYKRGIIEVIYVGETTDGRATRHKLLEMKTPGEPAQGDKIVIDFVIGANGYGKRLPKNP